MSKRKIQSHQIVIHAFFILFSLLFLLPLLLIISISFSSEAVVTAGSGPNAGYHLIPKVFSLEAYAYCLRNPAQLIQAYKVTAAESILGTLSALVVLGMVAYPLSRSSFAYRKPITFIIFFTMLFSGGMIPSYIVNTKLYHLGDSFWIYILPGITGGAWNTFVIRTFFKGLPEELFESAKIDGARELTIFFKIAVPLSTPVFATIGFMMLLGKWNDWNTPLIYIRNNKLFSLQYVLKRILDQVEFLQEMQKMNGGMAGRFQTAKLPKETMRYAMCVLAAGPMLFAFPFFQKYFEKGLIVGAVKG